MVHFSRFLNCLYFLILLLGISTVFGAPPRFKCVTWNVNGVEKLKDDGNVLAFLGGFEIILLQETYSGSNEDVLHLNGFIPHHQLARPTTRRAVWGVSTFFRIVVAHLNRRHVVNR
jgi:exonuclease III